MQSETKRFLVALSFPGEKRDYVSQVAECLSKHISKNEIFYDNWYTHELARPDLDLYLQNIYRSQSLLIVPFLCSEYNDKDWCGLEWRAIRDLIKERDGDSLMPARFDNVAVPGLFGIDGYLDLRRLTPDKTAELILKRLTTALSQESNDNREFATIKIVHPFIGNRPNLAKRINYLTQLSELLKTKTNLNENVIALHGLGGVGKTTLAMHYAFEHQVEFCGVWWIHAHSRRSIINGLVELGRRLFPYEPESVEQDDFVHRVLNHIASQQSKANKPWLLIFDDAENPSEIVDFFPNLGGFVLVTSRWADWNGVADAIKVDTFSNSLAIEFLLSRNRGENAESASKLADSLGFLPLALDQARSYCYQSGCSFQEYRAQVTNLIQRPSTNAYYQASVFATYSLAIDKVIETNPDAQKIVDLIAFLAPDNIPRDLLLNSNIDTINDCLKELSNYSLISFNDPCDSVIKFNCHRLVQETARERSVESRGRIINDCVDLLLGHLPKEIENPELWPKIRVAIPNILALTKHIIKYKFTSHKASVLIETTAAYLDIQGEYPFSEVLHRRALTISESCSKNKPHHFSWIHHNLALNLDHQGKNEAAENYHRKAWQAKKELLTEYHPDTILSYSNIAFNLNEQGRYEDSKAINLEVLRMRKTLSGVGRDHKDTAFTYSNLAANHKRLGNLRSAEKFSRIALEIRVRVLGEMHQDTAQSCNNTAVYLNGQNQHKDAEPLHRCALKIRKALYEDKHPNHPYLFESYGNLASTLSELSKYEEANKFYCLGMDILRNTGQLNSPISIKFRESYQNNLANL